MLDGRRYEAQVFVLDNHIPYIFESNMHFDCCNQNYHVIEQCVNSEKQFCVTRKPVDRFRTEFTSFRFLHLLLKELSSR